MTPDTKDVGIRVWTNPKAEANRASLFGLSVDALHLAVVPKAGLDQAAQDLQQGRELVKRMIPLATLTELQGEEGDQELTLTFKVADSTDSNSIQLATAADRDELLDALQSRLGPKWERVRAPIGRYWSAKWPLFVTVMACVLTWAMYTEAQHIDAGEHLEALGKRAKDRAFSQIMHWVEGMIGEVGVLIVGGLVCVLCAAWLLNSLLRPTICITIKPKAGG